MALPIWGVYMKSCMENEDLDIATTDFERPLKLTIEVDCENYDPTNNPDSNIPDVEVPDELDF
jgi:penicillin-binding protein 1A